MKKIHIAILVLIAVAIGVLISFMGNLTTYDTVATAKEKQGKFVHLIAKLDRSKPIEYDAVKDPNHLSFYAVDSVGGEVKVIYNKEKPTNLEHSERLVLKGKMMQDHFECNEILMKCPSKYKDDMKAAEKNLPAAAAATGGGSGDTETNY